MMVFVLIPISMGTSKGRAGADVGGCSALLGSGINAFPKNFCQTKPDVPSTVNSLS